MQAGCRFQLLLRSFIKKRFGGELLTTIFAPRLKNSDSSLRFVNCFVNAE
jgi:hypothetical protein